MISPNFSPLLAAAAALLASSASHAIEPLPNWTDSYSVDGQCYCDTTFDHGADQLIIETPQGDRTAPQVCAAIGPGPGKDGNPLYNDLQCGHGPPNDFADETECPGRVDQGEAGCFVRGPTWNLDRWFPGATPVASEGISAEVADQPVQGEGARLSLEAEAFDTIDDRWVLTDSLSAAPVAGYDDDGPAAQTASGGRYLELLPDQRVADIDPLGESASWQAVGTGPRLSHAMDFPQAGRWRVAVRGRANGAHDERISVGVDGLFADAGAELDLCGQQGDWAWSDCRDDTAWVDIVEAGVHRLELAGQDDGVELDRVILRRLGDVPAPVTPEQPVEREQPVAPPQPVEITAPVAPQPVEPAENGAEDSEPGLGKAVTVGGGVAAFGGAGLLGLCGLLAWRRQRSHRQPGRCACASTRGRRLSA